MRFQMLRDRLRLGVGVLLLTTLLTSCGYNSLQGMDEDVKSALSEVDNQYQRRSELIPNLVETVKGYAKHEKDTLEEVTKARAQATQTKLDVGSLSDPKAVQRFQAVQGELSQALSRLMVVVEKYPDPQGQLEFPGSPGPARREQKIGLPSRENATSKRSTSTTRRCGSSRRI